MAKRALRFGIRDSDGRRSATWKLWTETGSEKSDVYLTCRGLGGSLKTSLHESGEWHTAHSHQVFEERVRGAVPMFTNRFVDKWRRPAELRPGVTLACRIVIPWTSPSAPITSHNIDRVLWLPNAPKNKATEIPIFFMKEQIASGHWPGKRSMGTSLIGSIPLMNGETLWAVYHVIDMPDLSHLKNGVPRFFKGRSEHDVADAEGLRALVFGTEPDGSRAFYDIAVAIRPLEATVSATS